MPGVTIEDVSDSIVVVVVSVDRKLDREAFDREAFDRRLPGSERDVDDGDVVVSRNGMNVFLGERRGPPGDIMPQGEAVSLRSLLARNCLRADCPGT